MNLIKFLKYEIFAFHNGNKNGGIVKEALELDLAGEPVRYCKSGCVPPIGIDYRKPENDRIKIHASGLGAFNFTGWAEIEKQDFENMFYCLSQN